MKQARQGRADDGGNQRDVDKKPDCNHITPYISADW
jgi:hypothetical protein